jgi:large subunit ribosomal protein L9
VKVILQRDVERLGRAGEMVEVADGYARNYLLPRGWAEEATPQAQRRWQELRQQRQRREEREEAEAAQAQERLEAGEVRVSLRVGEGGRSFGSITAKDLQEAVQEQLGLRIDKRRFDLEAPIRAPGRYAVPVHLGARHRATLRVTVEEVRG